MRRLAVSALLLVLLPACGEPSDPSAREPASTSAESSAAPQARPPDPPLAYVGRETCAGCHPEAAAAFEGSHHDLAMGRPDGPARRAPLAEGTFETGGAPTRFRRAEGEEGEGGTFVVETRDAQGAPTTAEVAWTFGVEPLQQLLLAAEGGRLQAFDVAWEPEAGRWLDLYPDAAPGEPLHWTGYEQTANHQCIECHTTGFAKGYDARADRYDSTWAEPDVSCEACHGPGSRHVARARAAEPGASPGGLGVRFAGAGTWSLPPEAPIAVRTGPGAPSRGEIDTCARCHARRERFAADDRPDRDLLHAHRPAVLAPGLYGPDGSVRDEVFVWGSFVQSRMAEAGVTCSDCHEPHGLALRAEGNALCTSCHRASVYDVPEHHRHGSGGAGAADGPEDAVGSDASEEPELTVASDENPTRCASCHMPASTFMSVDARREHAFRIPRPDRAEALGTSDACTDCHADRSPAWAAEAIRAWHGPERPPARRFPEALHAARRVLPDAAPRLVALLGDAEEPFLARATAARELATYLDPRTAQALARATGDAEPLVRLEAARASQGLPPDLRVRTLAPLLGDPVRGVRMAAARALADVPAERLGPEARRRRAAALQELEAALARNADRPEARLERSLLHVRRGELAEARREAEAALARDPALPAAAVNLADVLRAQGKDAEGEEVLRQALARSPESAELAHALGLLLHRGGRPAEALESLRAASERVEDGRFAYAHALALVGADRETEGLEVLREALEARPGDRELLAALATLHRDRGELEPALDYARRLEASAPGAPGPAGLVRSLEEAFRARGDEPGAP